MNNQHTFLYNYSLLSINIQEQTDDKQLEKRYIFMRLGRLDGDLYQSVTYVLYRLLLYQEFLLTISQFKMDHQRYKQLSHNGSLPFLRQERYVLVQNIQPAQPFQRNEKKEYSMPTQSFKTEYRSNDKQEIHFMRNESEAQSQFLLLKEQKNKSPLTFNLNTPYKKMKKNINSFGKVNKTNADTSIRDKQQLENEFFKNISINSNVQKLSDYSKTTSTVMASISSNLFPKQRKISAEKPLERSFWRSNEQLQKHYQYAHPASQFMHTLTKQPSLNFQKPKYQSNSDSKCSLNSLVDNYHPQEMRNSDFLLDQIKKKDNLLESLQQEIRKLNTQARNFKNNEQLLQRQLQSLKTNPYIHTQLQHKNQQNFKLLDQIQKMQKELTDKSLLIRFIEQKNRDYIDQYQKIKAELQRFVGIQEENKKNLQIIDILRKQLEDLQLDQQSYRKYQNQLKKQAQKYVKTIETKQYKIEEYLKKQEINKSQIKILTMKLQNLQLKHQKQDELYKDLNKKIQESSTFYESMFNQKNQEILDINTHIKKYKQNEQTLSYQNRQLNNEIQYLNEQITLIRQQKIFLQQKFVEKQVLERINSELMKAKEEIHDRNKHIEQVNLQLKKCRNTLEDRQRNTKDLKQELQIFNKQNNHMTHQLKDLSSLYQQLQQAMDIKTTQLKQSQHQNLKYKNEADQYNQSLSNSQRQAQILRQEMNHKNYMYQRQTQRLNNQLKNIFLNYQELKRTYHQCIEELNQLQSKYTTLKDQNKQLQEIHEEVLKTTCLYNQKENQLQGKYEVIEKQYYKLMQKHDQEIKIMEHRQNEGKKQLQKVKKIMIVQENELQQAKMKEQINEKEHHSITSQIGIIEQRNVQLSQKIIKLSEAVKRYEETINNYQGKYKHFLQTNKYLEQTSKRDQEALKMTLSELKQLSEKYQMKEALLLSQSSIIQLLKQQNSELKRIKNDNRRYYQQKQVSLNQKIKELELRQMIKMRQYQQKQEQLGEILKQSEQKQQKKAEEYESKEIRITQRIKQLEDRQLLSTKQHQKQTKALRHRIQQLQMASNDKKRAEQAMRLLQQKIKEWQLLKRQDIVKYQQIIRASQLKIKQVQMKLNDKQRQKLQKIKLLQLRLKDKERQEESLMSLSISLKDKQRSAELIQEFQVKIQELQLILNGKEKVQQKIQEHQLKLQLLELKIKEKEKIEQRYKELQQKMIRNAAMADKKMKQLTLLHQKSQKESKEYQIEVQKYKEQLFILKAESQSSKQTQSLSQMSINRECKSLEHLTHSKSEQLQPGKAITSSVQLAKKPIQYLQVDFQGMKYLSQLLYIDISQGNIVNSIIERVSIILSDLEGNTKIVNNYEEIIDIFGVENGSNCHELLLKEISALKQNLAFLIIKIKEEEQENKRIKTVTNKQISLSRVHQQNKYNTLLLHNKNLQLIIDELNEDIMIKTAKLFNNRSLMTKTINLTENYKKQKQSKAQNDQVLSQIYVNSVQQTDKGGKSQPDLGEIVQ